MSLFCSSFVFTTAWWQISILGSFKSVIMCNKTREPIKYFGWCWIPPCSPSTPTSFLCGAFDLQRWAWRWWWTRWRRHKSGFCAHRCVFPAVLGSLRKDSQPGIRVPDGKLGKREAPALTVDVHVTLWAVQVVLLRHDDVLDVFHGQVVAESIVQQPLQLVHCQLLHVALRRWQIMDEKSRAGTWTRCAGADSCAVPSKRLNQNLPRWTYRASQHNSA